MLSTCILTYVIEQQACVFVVCRYDLNANTNRFSASNISITVTIQWTPVFFLSSGIIQLPSLWPGWWALQGHHYYKLQSSTAACRLKSWSVALQFIFLGYSFCLFLPPSLPSLLHFPSYFHPLLLLPLQLWDAIQPKVWYLRNSFLLKLGTRNQLKRKQRARNWTLLVDQRGNKGERGGDKAKMKIAFLVANRTNKNPPSN